MPAFLDFLSKDWMPFAIITKLAWLVQLGLMVHVFKTGRPYWWFWILLAAPLLGGIAYFFVELLPENRSSGHGLLTRLKPRAWRIRDAQAELDETPTVQTRLSLASELLEAGRAPEAYTVAHEALTGIFKDDPHTLAAVARYALEVSHAEEALTLLSQINTRADRMLALTVTLLRGRALLAAGRPAEAEPVLREAASRHVGEEARYFLAMSLRASGREPEAAALFQEIRSRYRKAAPAWRRTEKRWYQLATEALKAPLQKTAA